QSEKENTRDPWRYTIFWTPASPASSRNGSGQPSLRSGFRDDAGRRCNFLLPRPPPRLAIVKERTSFAEVGKTGGHVDARWNKICDRMAARPACAPQSAAGIARTGSGPL